MEPVETTETCPDCGKQVSAIRQDWQIDFEPKIVSQINAHFGDKRWCPGSSRLVNIE